LYFQHDLICEVASDKIGTSIYYWSFPSDAKRSRQAKIDELNKELQTCQQRQEEVRALIDQASNCRQDSDERDALLCTLRGKEEAKHAQEEELSRYKDSDPRAIAEKSRLVTLYKEAANLATDNICILQSYFVREMGFHRKDMNSQFGIEEDALDEVI